LSRIKILNGPRVRRISPVGLGLFATGVNAVGTVLASDVVDVVCDLISFQFVGACWTVCGLLR